MKMLKFGGTSVDGSERIRGVIEIIRREYEKDRNIWIVVSAMSGVTNSLTEAGRLAEKGDPSFENLLLEMEKRHLCCVRELFDISHPSLTGPDRVAPLMSGIETNRKIASLESEINSLFNDLFNVVKGVSLIRELSKRSLDLIMSFGELLSGKIISEFASFAGLPVRFHDARKLIVTDDNFGDANIEIEITRKNVRALFEQDPCLRIIPGFIGATEDGVTTTMGRGASDYTASVFGNILEADEIQIWSDVDGVMTASPKKVKKAFSIEEMTYEEAMELSHFGTKMLYPPTIQPAREKKIPIRICNTFNPQFKGTLVKESVKVSEHLIRGISSIDCVDLLRIQGSGMVGVTGTAKRLFSALALENINVIMITQASSEHSICIAVAPEVSKKACNLIEKEFSLEIKAHLVDRVIVEKGYSVIAVVGEDMRRTLGIAGRLFASMGRNGINVAAIAQGSSELNVSLLVSCRDEVKALNAIHETFFLPHHKTLNLFIAGTGLVGKTLLKQIKTLGDRSLASVTDVASDDDSFRRGQDLSIRVILLANSRKMVTDPEGIDLGNWEEQLENSADPSDVEKIMQMVRETQLPGKIFVDCTASSKISSLYSALAGESVSIVTPNKIGNVGPIEEYRALRKTFKKFNAQFFYETNVGAGLPVISSLRDLLDSGDRIISIEGVFSGTLSYIFNSFREGVSFSEVVKDAMDKGYTEPDPRIDLMGVDIARKILILARETGAEIDIEGVSVEKILPQECFETDGVETFFEALENYDAHFDEMRQEAADQGKVLRYIAEYRVPDSQGKGVLRVCLKQVDKDHPFYNLSGSDNIISFTTERYSSTPMVIKGAGAGAEVTAAGVLADILRLGRIILN